MTNDATEISGILKRELEMRRRKNPAFSLRAFSKKLGIGSSALSEILAGKRRVSEKKTQVLLARLGFSEMVDDQTIQLRQDQYELIANWLHFALLSHLQSGGSDQPVRIARRFGVTDVEAQQALERLARLKLIQRKQNHWVVAFRSVQSPDGVDLRAVRESHFESLRLAEQALESIPMKDRDFTSLTFCMRPEELNELRTMIRKFYQRIEVRFEREPREADVFRINLQVFSLTKGEEK